MREPMAAQPGSEVNIEWQCAGYRMFFNHIDGRMRAMAGLLKCGLFADEITAIEAGAPT